MKIRLFSDIHNEFAPVDYKIPELPEDSDTVLVLAGDIDVGGAKESLLDALSDRFKAVVYVAGNHEYYNHDMDYLNCVLLEKYYGLYNNVYYLNNSKEVIDGVVFYGGTGWTQVDDNQMYQVQRSMNDFNAIKKVNANTAKVRSLTPEDTNKINQRFKTNLEHYVKDRDKVVVVSHHTPSYLSCDDKFAGDRLNCAYHNKFDDLIKDNPNIKLWCHGHIHQSKDYMIGDTRVIANPYGYYNYETNPNFDSTKVIEI